MSNKQNKTVKGSKPLNSGHRIKDSRAGKGRDKSMKGLGDGSWNILILGDGHGIEHIFFKEVIYCFIKT